MAEASAGSPVTTSAAPAPSPPVAAPVRKTRSLSSALIPLVILACAAALLFTIAGGWTSWESKREVQVTDDAYVRSDLTPLSTRVSGTVALVTVNDYQKVKAGDLLVQLKDEDYKAQVEQAVAIVRTAEASIVNVERQKSLQDSRIAQADAGIEVATAQIAQAQAGIEASKAQIADAQAAVEATQADVVRTDSERRRQESLIEAGAATRQRLEQVVADADRFRAALAGRQAALAQARAGLEARKADLLQAEAGMRGRASDSEAQRRQRDVIDSQEVQARADLSARQASLKVAQTNLDYTRILAPADGVVGERKVRLGQLVSPGTQVISIVQSEPWIMANYKETQLAHVRRGDPVEITVDALPGLLLKGRVEEIAPASGSQFSLLPPDNATGNFTKIVQRIPVKILLESDARTLERLRPGMSVVPKIQTSTRTEAGEPEKSGN